MMRRCFQTWACFRQLYFSQPEQVFYKLRYSLHLVRTDLYLFKCECYAEMMCDIHTMLARNYERNGTATSCSVALNCYFFAALTGGPAPLSHDLVLLATQTLDYTIFLHVHHNGCQLSSWKQRYTATLLTKGVCKWTTEQNIWKHTSNGDI